MNLITDPCHTTLGPDTVVRAVFKVHQAHYVPPGVEVRARVDATHFTAQLRLDRIQDVNNDPKVAAVSLSKKLHLPPP